VPRNHDFQSVVERKTRAAEQAVIPPLVTVEDRSSCYPVRAVGNIWTERHFDGAFYLFEPPDGVPALSLIFVQSRDGNTVVANPAALGGGPVDYHLIFEGLSRVAADAVLAGAATVGRRVFFSVWHPELVALRAELGLPRHPAQVVLSRRGHLNLDESILFNVPGVTVFLMIGAEGLERCAPALVERPWIIPVPIAGDDLAGAFGRLRREHGVRRVSVVGGRTVATALLDAGLTQDLCLTTTSVDGGTANTPVYAGTRPPTLDLIVRKRGTGESAITFDHFAVRNV
jgi:riboflavin biosynthesis pyrimidine reductase